jgi:hypothetical protein
MKRLLITLTLCALFFASNGQSSSLWEINQMKLHDPKDLQSYVKFIELNWGKTRELGQKEKYLLSYRILHDTTTTKEKAWDVMLMTEYASKEQMHRFEADYSSISKRAGGSVAVDGKKTFPDFGKNVYYRVLLEGTKH